MAELDLQAYIDQAPLHRNMDLRIERTDHGVLCWANVGPDFIVSLERGTIHGGIVASLLDTAAVFALIATSGHNWVTVDLRVDYLRPVPGGEVTIEGETLRSGRRLGTGRAVLRDATGRECAVAVGTFAAAGEVVVTP